MINVAQGVKVRTATYSGVKEKRLPYFLQGVFWVCLLVITSLLCYGLLVFSAWVYRHPVRQIVVSGKLTNIDRGRLRLILLKDLQGQSWLSLSLPGVRRSLGALSWVEDAAVAREWPWQLRVTVTELQAVAKWQAGSLLAADGSVITSKRNGAWPNLIQLHGPAGSEAKVFAEYKLLLPQFAAAHGIADLSLSDSGQWSLQTKSGIKIELGRDSIRLRLQRVLAALTQLEAAGNTEIKYIDTRYPNGLAVLRL